MEFYYCPRCNYQTTHKSNIRTHFKRQKVCANKNGIELTDDIREIVLRDHQYHYKKKDKTITINQTISQYNILSNFINQMDMIDKINHLLFYQNKQIMDIEENLDVHFEKRIKKLEDDQFKIPYQLSQDDLIELINDVTKINRERIEQLNVLFDKKINRFKFYRTNEWESYIEDGGVKELISLIKSYFLDTYEVYLIRKLHRDSEQPVNRSSIQHHLKIYYQFLAIFDLPVFIFGLSDVEILGHKLKEDNDRYLEEYYTRMYSQEKTNIKESDKNRIKKKIINIVKENTVHNLSELNAAVLEFLRIDDNFRDQLLKNQSLIETGINQPDSLIKLE